MKISHEYMQLALKELVTFRTNLVAISRFGENDESLPWIDAMVEYLCNNLNTEN